MADDPKTENDTGTEDRPEEQLACESDDQTGEEAPEETLEPEQPEAMPFVADQNQFVMGQLVLHYPLRDVTLRLDGGAAMQLLKMFQRRRRNIGEVLDESSTATAGWVVLDLGEPLAMSWLPAGSPAWRTAVDPPVAQRA